MESGWKAHGCIIVEGEKRKKLASKKYFDSIKVSGKYTEDKAELLKMFYVMRSYDKKRIQKILKEAVHIENRPVLKAVARILQIFLNRFQKYLGEEQIKFDKMKKEDEELLAKSGWVVECESPLEIRHGDGSFATMQAAEK